MQLFIEQNIQTRQQAAQQAELMIEQKVAQFLLWQQAQAATQVIRQYRTWADQQQEALLSKSAKLLTHNQEQRELLAQIMTQQKNKLLHLPTLLLRQLAQQGQAESLALTENYLNKLTESFPDKNDVTH